MREFTLNIQECRLLFGKDIRLNIEEIFKMARENLHHERTITRLEQGEKRAEAVDKVLSTFDALSVVIPNLMKKLKMLPQ